MSRRHFYLIGFVALIAFDVFSNVFFKLAAIHAQPLELDPCWLLRVFSEPWIYGSLLGYTGAFVTWMTLLRHAPIGPAFAVSHMEVIGVMIVSIPLFHEHLSAIQLIGAALIISGVICLALSEPDTPED